MLLLTEHFLANQHLDIPNGILPMVNTDLKRSTVDRNFLLIVSQWLQLLGLLKCVSCV